MNHSKTLPGIMLTQKPQAVLGVSPNHETVIEVLYPSIAITRIGDRIGQILESIPTRFAGIKVSNLLFGLPLAPVAALIYFWLKLFGPRYVLTNREVRCVDSIGIRLRQSILLSKIKSIGVNPLSQQEFYKTGDIQLIGCDGQVLMSLCGVPRPERFCHVIQETRDAKHFVELAMAKIKARH